jgi:glycosyltransferase involved in cell wall biosynthesis
MKIQCYMPVHNEADILPHTLRHLHEQGCAVHVIDGWSDKDASFRIACEFADEDRKSFSVESFPPTGPDSIQNCTAILKRIEDLAAASDADWCLYSDADEWRRSRHEDETIGQMCQRFSRTEINAIDFRVFQFYCTGEIWPDHIGDFPEDQRRDCSPEEVFQYYDESDCISRIPNRKLWKNVGRVQLAGGGHEVTFPGIHIAKAGVMKHYPFRTPEQARRKIETRLARRCHPEHAKGWGVHYDQYPPGFDFRWDPAKLLFWKDTRSPLP